MAKNKDAAKKASYPQFDDTKYVEYLSRLREKYVNALKEIAGHDGLHHSVLRDEDRVKDLQEKLADFDYEEISGTLAAQKRWPPEGDAHATQTYEYFAELPKKLQESFDGKTADNFTLLLNEFAGYIRSGSSMAGYGFAGLRNLKRALGWLYEKFPQIDSQPLAEVRAKVAREFDPRWALISAGPLHEKYMGQILFSTSRALPLTDEWPETINPLKESVYAHVFLDRSIKDVTNGDLLFLVAGDERYTFSVKALGNDEHAYLCLAVYPEHGRNPDLIRTIGSALAKADGELAFLLTPAAAPIAVGTLKMKMTKAEAAKLGARTEALAAQAEANRMAAAVLPDIFTKAQKWPYKDSVLAPEKVAAAIEEAWEYNWKERIKVRHLRVNHYRPGYEWDQELDPWNRPVQRLTFSYLGMVFERDGTTFYVADGIQARQFHMLGKGYGEDLNILFWGVKAVALPPEQVKRIAA